MNGVATFLQGQAECMSSEVPSAGDFAILHEVAPVRRAYLTLIIGPGVYLSYRCANRLNAALKQYSGGETLTILVAESIVY